MLPVTFSRVAMRAWGVSASVPAELECIVTTSAASVTPPDSHSMATPHSHRAALRVPNVIFLLSINLVLKLSTLIIAPPH